MSPQASCRPRSCSFSEFTFYAHLERCDLQGSSSSYYYSSNFYFLIWKESRDHKYFQIWKSCHYRIVVCSPIRTSRDEKMVSPNGSHVIVTEYFQLWKSRHHRYLIPFNPRVAPLFVANKLIAVKSKLRFLCALWPNFP